jgi:DNA-binding beta-propeller fold protein YncE
MANALPKLVLAALFALTTLASAGIERLPIQGSAPALAGYRFNITTDIVNLSAPITISAVDSQGNIIQGFTGEVNLSVPRPDGVRPWRVFPATVQLSGSGWTGNITLPPGVRLPAQLRATDGDGYTGESIPFDVMRAIPLKTADIVWDATRSRIYASVPATGGAYANQVVAIDPNSLQIVGNVAVNQDPRKLTLTQGGEALYVALDANGTIAKIDPASMVVASTFPVGVDSYGPLYAEDMCPVAGQPDLVVVSRYSKGYAGNPTVAAYENGVMRPHLASVTNRIEPSANPAIFFGYQTWSSGFAFRQLLLDANGMNLVAESANLISGFQTEIRSDGDTVFTSTGVEIDGAGMIRMGTFPLANSSALICPDLAANRVYFTDARGSSSGQIDAIKAFEPTTFAFMRQLTLPAIWPRSFIRWGTNGLAIAEGNSGSLLLLNSNRLVPNDPPADLAVTVEAAPNPAWAALPLDYAVSVVNQGPNIARDILLRATLSDSQTWQTIHASTGTVAMNALGIDLRVEGLAVGESATLFIRTLPSSAGMLFCKATASSSAADPDFINNATIKTLKVGFRFRPSTPVNVVRLSSNNLIFDPTRNVLWATISNQSTGSTNVFPDKSLVAINPVNGLTSDPIPINDLTIERSIAISPDGRYLYIGLYTPSELLRVDLSSEPYTTTRIHLGTNPSGQAMYAQDIEVLNGDGTSFLMTGAYDHAAVVFDGSIPRPIRTAQYSVSRIERTASPSLYVGYNNYTFPTATFATTKLSVTPSGVSIIQTNSSLIVSYAVELRGSGNLVLSNSGRLVDTSTFTVRADLGISGIPCLDFENSRAYLLNGSTLYAFNTTTGSPAGTFSLPGSFDNWGPACVRWGTDSFAIAGNHGDFYLARWSNVIPSGNQ